LRRASASAYLQVVAGAGFNTTLPRDPATTKPTLQSEVSVDHCECVIQFEGVAASIQTWQGRRFHHLSMEEAGVMGDEGRPEIPVLSLLFAVPGDPQTKQAAGANVQVEEKNPQTYADIVPYPVQPPAWDLAGQSTPDFALDEAFYNSSGPYPAEAYSTEQFQMGNLTILRVDIYPVRYYPATKELVLSRRIDLDVAFSGAKALAPPALIGDYTGAGRAGDEALARLMVNDSVVRRLDAQNMLTQLLPIDPVNVNDDQFELLVITRPALFAQARRLALHRQSQGWRVALASLSETTYPDEDAIRDYIIARDEANTVTFGGAYGFEPETTYCMRAVLLFGDVEQIPPFAGLNTGLAADPTEPGDTVGLVGTDLYYSVLRGLDDKPDVWLGRIPADDITEATPVVDKLIQYDALPVGAAPNHMAFYGQFQDDVTAQLTLSGTTSIWNNSLLAMGTGTAYLSEVEEGQFLRPSGTGRDEEWYEVIEVRTDTEILLDTRYPEDGVYGGSAEVGFRDGRADWPFIDTTERVRRFMTGTGVNVRYGYEHVEGLDPILFQDGTDLPPDLLAYAWNASEATVHNYWISGRDGIILHRDHGWTGGSGWSHPPYGQESFAAMTSPDTAFYPFVLSMNCQSGWYDAPVDRVLQSGGTIAADLSSSVGRTCFCVEALLYPQGGALAIVGASRNSSSGPNDRLTDGMFRAMYADYLPSAVRPMPAGFTNDLVGSVVLVGKFYHDILETRAARSQYYYELYNLFGDPTTTLRLPAP
jgi:Peptidase family C25/Propeptide_C25